jgi:hypothetical protein
MLADFISTISSKMASLTLDDGSLGGNISQARIGEELFDGSKFVFEFPLGEQTDG